MEDLPLGIFTCLVAEFAVTDLPLSRTLMIDIEARVFRVSGCLMWSKILMELLFTPMVNFIEVRRAQLAKSTLLTSTLVPLGHFQIS